MNEMLKINEDENCVFISINPKIYPLDVIYTVSYVFLEKAYLILDGEPDKEIIVKLIAKIKVDKEQLRQLGNDFFNELINYGFYKNQSEKNNVIRQILLQKALFGDVGEDEEELGDDLDEIDLEDDLDEIEDPEQIAVPWEEKYGKNKNGN
ncbi:hypothetical protein KKH26_02035 [Patescibacteria group bacterium]|nr:hypothetical protein [Patescibacteria group bacterium]